MNRRDIDPRPDWSSRVESQGFLFHSAGGSPYWDESACYEFSAAEIDRIEAATNELERLCLEAVQSVIDRNLYAAFEIPGDYIPLIVRSWERDEHALYGRFDLAYDGQGVPKMLEYNADTPTSLLEAAVIQWQWLEDVAPSGVFGDPEQVDQYNSIHERLIAAWTEIHPEIDGPVHFLGLQEVLEDFMTVSYLRDTAIQAGLETEFVDLGDVGWNPGRRAFIDGQDQAIRTAFKLYPWEWLVRESFGPNLRYESTRWLEPPWKMLLSNKAILPILWELFPGHPNLLRAEFEPFGDTFVVKPILSREGANVAILERGRQIAATGGDYGDGPKIFQAYQPLPRFAGKSAVLGSWLVHGEACGLGIREDDGPITGNLSRFVPHYFRGT